MLLWRALALSAAAVFALALASASASPLPCVCNGNRTECSAHAKTSIAAHDICAASTVWIFCDNALLWLPSGVGTDAEELDVARNQIESADAELRAFGRLRELDVSANLLEHLRFLPRRCALRRLRASGNRISSLEGPLASCSALEELWLTDNRLGAQPDGVFAALANLRALSLSQNPLHSATPGTFRGLSRLMTLELRNTELDSLSDGTFEGLGELRALDLDENHLRAVSRNTFRGLSALTDLHLCYNHIASLPADTFSETRRLIHLFVDHNELTAFPDGVFAGLPLEELWARWNALDGIPLLRECCARLRVAALDGNRARAPSEEALRALLRAGVQRASLEGNPLRAEALAWVARAADLELRVDSQDCHCGALALRGQRAPTGSVSLCVEVECGPGARWAHWADAVRAAAENAA